MPMVVDPLTAITPRQLELLALYASGYDLKEIAETKFMSYSSVRGDLAAARDRVGAKTLPNLIAICVESRVIVRNGTAYIPVQEERVIGE
jgi:DNA-binding CsgD family transcriptional regulator